METELVWEMPVILYLFLAGLGAGTVTASASVLLRGGSGSANRYFSVARYGALVGPLPVIIGTSLLVFELGRPFRALNLFKVINLSPMSIGTWFLAFFILVSLVYALLFLPWPSKIFDRLDFWRRALAWICVPLGICVAVYTGVLLGAMPSRPFWNSPILAMLFLISALSTGIAMIILTRALFYKKQPDSSETEGNYHQSGYLLTASDIMLIGFELLVIFLFVMFAHLTIGNVKYAVATILPGGALALSFWLWVVLIGMVIPAVIELVYVVPKLLYDRTFAVPRVVEIAVPVAILVGGFMLRYVVVIAGQITGPVGL